MPTSTMFRSCRCQLECSSNLTEHNDSLRSILQRSHDSTLAQHPTSHSQLIYVVSQVHFHRKSVVSSSSSYTSTVYVNDSEGFTICGLTVHRFICAAICARAKRYVMPSTPTNTTQGWRYQLARDQPVGEGVPADHRLEADMQWSRLANYYASLVRSHKD